MSRKRLQQGLTVWQVRRKVVVTSSLTGLAMWRVCSDEQTLRVEVVDFRHLRALLKMMRRVLISRWENTHKSTSLYSRRILARRLVNINLSSDAQVQSQHAPFNEHGPRGVASRTMGARSMEKIAQSLNRIFLMRLTVSKSLIIAHSCDHGLRRHLGLAPKVLTWGSRLS